MAKLDIPFNISILNLTEERLHGVRPTRSMDIFEGATRNFHPDGLFSTLTFGKIGDDRRNLMVSYIDIKIPIFHPVVFRALGDIKSLYHEIITAKTFAVWDKSINDFVKSNPLEGDTGFDFFLTHWKKINYEHRPSTMREQNIGIINKYQDRAMMSKILVIPAGLRDVEIDNLGRVSENEINPLYRKLLSLSQSVSQDAINNNPRVLDSIRVNLQNTYIQIYEMIETMIEGKKKLLMGKWASRKIFNGTRNVITSTITEIDDLETEGKIGVNHTVIGLYQYLKGTLPVSTYQIKNGFLSNVFIGPNAPAQLVDKKTLKKVSINLKPEYYDSWMTNEGIEKVITSFSEESIRHTPLEINGYYIGLIYKGPDKTFKLFQDIDDLPKNFSRENVFPITFCELLYLSVFRHSGRYPCFVTRYPIAGEGSIYPSYCYLKTTNKYETRKELGFDWGINSSSGTAYQFPIPGSTFFNSLAPSSAHLGKLTADFDGDVKYKYLYQLQ